MRNVVLLVSGAMIVAGAAACGSSHSPTQPPPPTATDTISVSTSGFAPETLTAATNTEVVWKVVSGTHQITFTADVPPGGSPSSDTLTVGKSAFAVFTRTGSYPYKCSIHPSETGVVIVH